CIFTDSSTRAWMVTDLGCLGGALMIAMLSFVPPLRVCLTYCVTRFLVPTPARPRHELRIPAARGGSDPRSPKGPGPRFCGTVGSVPPPIVFLPGSGLVL